MCTYRRILDAEPLRAPQVFEHATLSPTITFHSNAPSTRLLLNRLLTSAGEQRQLPLWRRVLCPKVGAQASGWVWRGAIFMCLLVRRLRWSAATPSSTARVPSTTPPLPLLGLAAGSSQRCSSPMTCGTPPQASLSATTAAARDRLASCARPRRLCTCTCYNIQQQQHVHVHVVVPVSIFRA